MTEWRWRPSRPAEASSPWVPSYAASIRRDTAEAEARGEPVRPRGTRSGHAPDAPQRRRVAQRVAVHEREVGGPAHPDHSCLWLPEQFAAAPGHRGQGLPRLKPGLDQALDLP